MTIKVYDGPIADNGEPTCYEVEEHILERPMCPFCGCVMPNDETYFELVSYWAEGGPQEVVCGACEQTYWTKEYVKRWFRSTKEKLV